MPEEPPYDVPLNRADLETQGLDARDTIRYVQRKLEQCLDATDREGADVEAIKERYESLADHLRDAADRLDE